MIDRCARPGCQSLLVSRDADMRPLLRRRFCSRQCSDAVTKPVHLEHPDRPGSACGSMYLLEKNRNRFTDDHLQVTCGACKQTRVYKERDGALFVN